LKCRELLLSGKVVLLYICVVKPLFSSSFTLGIVGGGQLGKMLLYDCRKMDIRTHVLDPSADAPCRLGAHSFVQGDLLDYDTVYQFGLACDVITIEIEHVNTDALKALKAAGKQVHPDPDALQLIQDKGLQKQYYAAEKIPTAAFRLWSGAAALQAAFEKGEISLPLVWKSTRFGYDGKGVKVLRQAADLAALPETACITEDMVPIEKELAVIAARNPSGEIRCFPACEMVFHAEANLVTQVVCPASIDTTLANEAESLAKKLIEGLNICGLLAVEFFITRSGELLVNEIAPRPHNSGHYTIEASFTSQYEQHLRGILNLPLGDTDSKCPAVMVNLVGEAGHSGPVYYAGAREVLAFPGVFLHVYGKSTTRPFRKMGHITVVGKELTAVRALANSVTEKVKVISQ
jgi:5-(carboxyamino)imidazole ribonucleotide synthase